MRAVDIHMHADEIEDADAARMKCDQGEGDRWSRGRAIECARRGRKQSKVRRNGCCRPARQQLAPVKFRIQGITQCREVLESAGGIGLASNTCVRACVYASRTPGRSARRRGQGGAGLAASGGRTASLFLLTRVCLMPRRLFLCSEPVA